MADPDVTADLAAYLDGELDPAAAQAVAARLARDPKLRAEAAALKKSFDLLDYLPRPAPRADFTSRTLTRIDAVAGPSAATDAYQTAAGRVRSPGAGRRRAVTAAVAAGVVAVGLATGAGARWIARAAADRVPADAAAIARVADRAGWYAGVDDLDYLKAVAATGLFPPDPPAGPLLAEPRGRSTSAAIGLFDKLPADRRRQLLKLDRELEADPDADQLKRVLEAYAVWLDWLDGPARLAVLADPTPGDRLDHVRRLRASADGTVGPTLAATRAAWAAGRWAGPKPWPFDTKDGAAGVEQFVKAVLHADPKATGKPADATRPSLAETLILRDRRALADADPTGWKPYGAYVYHLARRHPTLPGPAAGDPVTTPAHLPPRWAGRPAVSKLPAGRWPEFALGAADLAAKLKLPAPPLGPARPGEFKPDFEAFLATFRRDLPPARAAELDALAGKWPDYPRRVLTLAAAADLEVPGVSLPGPPARWRAEYGVAGPRPGD